MNVEQNIVDIALLNAEICAYEKKTREEANEYEGDEFQDGVTAGILSAVSEFKKMVRGIKVNDGE